MITRYIKAEVIVIVPNDMSSIEGVSIRNALRDVLDEGLDKIEEHFDARYATGYSIEDRSA